MATAYHRSAWLRWEKPATAPGGFVHDYQYRWKTTGGYNIWKSLPQKSLRVLVHGLTNTSHTFQVRAIGHRQVSPVATAAAVTLATPTARLYWTEAEAGSSGKIRRAALAGTGASNRVTGLNDPAGLALDAAGGRLYWTETGADKIVSATLDGAGAENLVTGLSDPTGLALDVAGNRIYWTETGGSGATDKIKRANLNDGKNVTDLVTGLDDPQDLALDVARGRLYWTEAGGTDTIKSAALDGTGNPTDVVTGLNDPTGLSLDVANSKLYWTETGGTDALKSASLSGSGIETLSGTGKITNLDDPTGLALDVDTAEGRLYWTETGGTDKIRRAKRDGTSADTNSIVTVNTPRGIALLLKPGTPRNLTAAPTGSGQVTLSWALPVAGGAVGLWEYSQDDGTNWKSIPNSQPGTTRHVVTGLTDGTSYTFKVRGVNMANDGPASASASAQPGATPAPGGDGGGGGGGGAISPPDAPSALTAQGGPGNVTLSWTAEANESITGWQYSSDNGTTWRTVPGSGAATRSYIVRGLTPGRAYTFRVRALNRAGIGARSASARATPESGASSLENPAPTGVQSGIGLLSGWVCAAGTVTFNVTAANGTTHRVAAAYGTPRADTAEACGDSDNGFGLLFNWNLLGPGSHTVRLLVDGQEVASRQVTVVTLGTEFLQGASGRYTIEDFPRPGESVTLQWDEASQNFRLAPAGAVPTGPVVSGLPMSTLENPAPNSVQSGIGLLSGWVCEAETVEVRITTAGGAVHELPVAYGTSRTDTADGCGDSDNGFGLLFNWNLLGPGTHTIGGVVASG